MASPAAGAERHAQVIGGVGSHGDRRDRLEPPARLHPTRPRTPGGRTAAVMRIDAARQRAQQMRSRHARSASMPSGASSASPRREIARAAARATRERRAHRRRAGARQGRPRRSAAGVLEVARRRELLDIEAAAQSRPRSPSTSASAVSADDHVRPIPSVLAVTLGADLLPRYVCVRMLWLINVESTINVGSIVDARPRPKHLGIQPRTLYAYVSRGQVRSVAGEHGRAAAVLRSPISSAYGPPRCARRPRRGRRRRTALGRAGTGFGASPRSRRAAPLLSRTSRRASSPMRRRASRSRGAALVGRLEPMEPAPVAARRTAKASRSSAGSCRIGAQPLDADAVLIEIAALADLRSATATRAISARSPLILARHLAAPLAARRPHERRRHVAMIAARALGPRRHGRRSIVERRARVARRSRAQRLDLRRARRRIDGRLLDASLPAGLRALAAPRMAGPEPRRGLCRRSSASAGLGRSPSGSSAARPSRAAVRRSIRRRSPRPRAPREPAADLGDDAQPRPAAGHRQNGAPAPICDLALVLLTHAHRATGAEPRRLSSPSARRLGWIAHALEQVGRRPADPSAALLYRGRPESAG